MSILIKNVLVNNQIKDILIEGEIISKIGKDIVAKADYVIEGKNKVAIPSFFNMHTHAAMTLMRGYADDMKVIEWLQTKIWPLEEKLSEEDVYWGTKLACLEMIKSGTTFFNDMYWHYHGTARAVEEMGIRAVISPVFIDLFDKEKASKGIAQTIQLFEESKQRYSKRIIFALGPHALYTVSKESLQWLKKFADKNRLFIHFHLSESEQEIEDCIKINHMRPVEYLEKIGFLGSNILAGHCIWLDDNELEILRKHEVKIVHNPISNMKLCSGILRYEQIKSKNISVSLGTDGCASNNSLDMFTEMKVAALLNKLGSRNPTMMPAKEIFELATIEGAKAFNINAGKIEEGKLADLLLIDLDNISLNPPHNLLSNLVYSANGSCVDTTICNGKILMQARKVDGEEEIVRRASEIASNLVKRLTS